MKYTHLEIGEENRSISGYYSVVKEVRLEYQGKQVLYVVGQAVLDTSCCGYSSFTYAIVPGYIIEWQGDKSAQGLPVSEVEPIRDKNVQAAIAAAIRAEEAIHNIQFG